VICTVGKISDVQELMLIVTGVPLDRDQRAARDGGVAPLRLPWEPVAEAPNGAYPDLLHRLGRDDLYGVSPAQLLAGVRRAARDGSTPPTAVAGQSVPWLLSPLHCVAGLDRLHLPAYGLLDLPMEQWAELCRGLTRELGDGQLALTPVDGRTALLEGAPLGALVTVEPDELVGAELRDCQPSGAGASHWRALQGEIELWLHAHPVNRARERASLAPVTTLWLWGGAARDVAATASEPVRAAAHGVRAAAAQPWSLHGLGAWGRALAALQPGVDAVDASDGAALPALIAQYRGRSLALRVSAAAGLAELESRWIAPAAAALQRGDVGALTLWHGTAAWRLARRRWWQRGPSRRSVAELFAAGRVAQVAR
jgi:hypothetical protein